jgi:hypothetical protein
MEKIDAKLYALAVEINQARKHLEDTVAEYNRILRIKHQAEDIRAGYSEISLLAKERL